MNINEFRNQFPDEEVCRQYLEKAIWHQGRICPHCNVPPQSEVDFQAA